MASLPEIGSTNFYQRCVHDVTGIIGASYSADASFSPLDYVDGCGENIGMQPLNVLTVHSYEGRVLGSTPSGICVESVGTAMALTDGSQWDENADDSGTKIVMTAGYSETANEHASFKLTAQINPNY